MSAKPRPIDNPFDALASWESPNVRLLRENAEIARRLNEESKFDPIDGDAA